MQLDKERVSLATREAPTSLEEGQTKVVSHAESECIRTV